MNLADLATGLIKDIGFPVFVAIYLLILFKNHISANTKALNSLEQAIKSLINMLEGK